AELTEGILLALAQERQNSAAPRPPRPRGRPHKTHRRRAQQRPRLQAKLRDWFDGRHLVVPHHLTVAERPILQRITRGRPQLRAARDILDESYRRVARRGRTETARAKLAKLRRRGRRFKAMGPILGKRHAPYLEKALTVRDDRLLPSPSNAGARENRRHRKMQKSGDRVRTQDHIEERIALDMIRARPKSGRS